MPRLGRARLRPSRNIWVRTEPHPPVVVFRRLARYAARMENIGRRHPAKGVQISLSEPAIVFLTVCTEKLVAWLEKDRYLTMKEGHQMLDELLSLKYMNHLSPFIRRLARDYHEALAPLGLLRVAEDPVIPKKGS